MKIYLAGSISGGRDFADGLKAINDSLIRMGHEVLTPFVVDEEINKTRFPDLTGVDRSTAIFEEDLRLIEESEAVIAEVSRTSTGVGMELGYLVGLARIKGLEKPTLLLRHHSLGGSRTSNLLVGNPYAKFLYYSPDNVNDLIQEFFTEIEEGKIRRETE